MSPAVFLSRQMLVTWTSEKACVLVHKHTENVLSPGVNLSTEENWDINRVSHFRTSRQKKLFSLAGCFLHLFVIGVPDLLSNVLAFRETGLKHSSWIFFSQPQVISLYHSSDLPALSAQTPAAATEAEGIYFHLASILTVFALFVSPSPWCSLPYARYHCPDRAFQNAKERTSIPQEIFSICTLSSS